MLTPPLNTNDDHISGWIYAPIELVQYGDFQCRHCGRLYVEIKKLQEVLGDQLKFAFRHYPLPNIHPLALDAAIATELASLENKFWHMHDIIFENQEYLTRASFSKFSEEIETNTKLFADNAIYKKMTQKVINDFESGVISGVNGTPTFFINGTRYDGQTDFEGLYAACMYALQKNEMEIQRR